MIAGRSDLYQNFHSFCTQLNDFDEKRSLRALLYPPTERLLFNPVSLIGSLNSSDRALNAAEQNLLKKRVKQWGWLLFDELESCRYNTARLKKLQGWVNTIFSQQKSQLIRDKLSEKKIDNGKISGALTFFDNMVMRVLTTPKLTEKEQRRLRKKTALSLTSSQQELKGSGERRNGGDAAGVSKETTPPQIRSAPTYACSDKTPASSPTTMRGAPMSPTPRVRQALMQAHFERMERIKKLEKIAERFIALMPRENENWKGELLENVKALKGEEECAAVGQKIAPLQLHHILENVDTLSNCYDNIVYLLGSVSFDIWQPVLLTLSDETIAKVNGALKQCSKKSVEWFNSIFVATTSDLIAICNIKKDTIDLLADRFRHKIPSCNISSDDLKVVDTLKKEILFFGEIVEKMRLLLNGIISDPMITGDLKEIRDEFSLLLTRLSDDDDVVCDADKSRIVEAIAANLNKLKEKYDSDRFLSHRVDEAVNYIQHTARIEPHANKMGGCLYSIIYRKVFLKNYCHMDSDAHDIFPAWDIIEPKDYYQCGLLGPLTDDEFHQLEANNTPAQIEKLCVDSLEKHGIKKVSDWMRLKIFNRTLLTNHLTAAT